MLPTLSQLNVAQPQMGGGGPNLIQHLQQQMQMPIPAQDAILPNTDFSLGIKCLFKARHPLEYVAPLKKKFCRLLDPVLNPFDKQMQAFEDDDPPEVAKAMTLEQIKNHVWLQRQLSHINKQKVMVKDYQASLVNYSAIQGVTQDPLKTLFVSKLVYIYILILIIELFNNRSHFKEIF